MPDRYAGQNPSALDILKRGALAAGAGAALTGALTGGYPDSMRLGAASMLLPTVGIPFVRRYQ